MSERTPLVLCPGLLCDEALWAYQLEHLADVAEARAAGCGGAILGKALYSGAIELEAALREAATETVRRC